MSETRLTLDELIELGEEADTDEGVQALDCHDMLLRLAGKVPDELLSRCRSWLAGHEFEVLAKALTIAITSRGVPIAAIDLALLAELLEPAGAGVTELGQIEADDSDPPPFFRFAADIPAGLQAPWPGPGTPPGPGTAESALAKALAAEPEALGAWRAWRFPADGSQWPLPKRVFVVEVAAEADQVALTARLQDRLTAAGEQGPQLEVYTAGRDLPAYQRLARSHGGVVRAAGGRGIPDAVSGRTSADAGPGSRRDRARPGEETSEGLPLRGIRPGDGGAVVSVRRRTCRHVIYIMDMRCDRLRRGVPEFPADRPGMGRRPGRKRRAGRRRFLEPAARAGVGTSRAETLAMYHQDCVIAGVRPEALTPARPGATGSVLRGKVISVDYQGPEWLAGSAR